ncbi:MAG: WbqC family protein [Bacteroidales bacterium]|nr:WbqC family protein [Bacteroidales bacterium]
MEALLSTAYLPPVEWFAAYAQADAVWLEAEEHYLKQTYRNRCILLNVSGSVELSVPVSKTVPNHCPIRGMRISYAENWPRNHWRSIETSYSTSPYFLYYRDYLEPFYLRRYDWLWDFNLEMLSVMLRLLRLPERHRLTVAYEAQPSGKGDFRALIHPKRRPEPDYPFRGQEPYRQVFAGQQPFTPNLSVLDLLCNLGPESAEYLKRQPLPAVAL